MAKDITLLGANYEDVPAVKLPQTGGGEATFYDLDGVDYAGSTEPAGNAIRTNGILYGQVDPTSTSTVFTATIPGVTEYYDGLTILLKNGVVTSTTNFTININGLGAKGSYSNMAAATRDTTIFNVNYTMMFIYDSTRVSGGGWICYRGYDANTNTIGYQLRTNSTVMNVSDTARYYKIYFTSADGTMWVPASVNSTNNATSARPVNQRPINPFGRIVYTSASTNYAAGANLAATTIWEQYTLSLGYSFNRTGAALNLTLEKPVYIKCAPQSDGSAIIDADTPYVQALPTTEDGKIYIYLGVAYSATAVEMVINHPVYYYKDGAIRLWTNAEAGLSSVAWNDVTGKPTFATVATSGSYNDLSNKPTIPTVPSAATASPLMDGTAAVGTSAKWAKEDHRHPTDTSRQATLVSGTNIKTVNGNSILGSGNLSISGLPTVTASDNGKVLTVVNGAWAAAELPVYTGGVS